jgi:FkbM family methyltransferase
MINIACCWSILKTLRSTDLKPADNELISNKHIAIPGKLSSHVRGLINLIKIFQQYRRTYLNYWSILLHIAQKRYPMKATLRNGNHAVLTSFFQSYNLAQLHGQNEFEYDILNDTVSILDVSAVANSKSDLKFYGGLSNGEVVNIFIDNVYNILPVEGKVVFDVGANIADSAIYFALRAARRVIGVEPFPKNIEIAKKNIEINDLSNKVTVLLAGCGADLGFSNIDLGRETGIESQIGDKNLRLGTTVPLVTLQQLLNEYKIRQEKTVLKIDCEGCEYDVILSATDDILTRFSDIIIEYHYGPDDLKERLEKCGFEVSLINLSGKPGGATTVPDTEKIGHWYYMGYIYAKQKIDTK